MDAEAVGVIKADNRGDEKFDVLRGIPVRENLYVNIQAREYLYDAGYSEHTGLRSEIIQVKKTYNLSWKEDEGYYDTNYCGSGTRSHGSGTWCTDSDGDGINDDCPGHEYEGCVDTDGGGLADNSGFNLQDGDIVFYDTDKRSTDDYRVGGTH